MFEIRHYLTEANKNPYAEWLRKLRDNLAKAAVIRRIVRVEQGNFGDHASVGEGVFELRIDVGPGYRVYYGMADKEIVLLLCAGDKSSQSQDIFTAKSYWKDWKGRLK